MARQRPSSRRTGEKAVGATGSSRHRQAIDSVRASGDGQGRLFEYVKVCSLYGAGFYYMPGTDICIKLGGYVRAQYYAWGGATGTVNGYTGSSAVGQNAVYGTRTGGNQDYIARARVIASWDTRQQTEYGTLRSYMNIGWTYDTGAPATVNPSNGPYFNRGFIQIAGFTFGKAQSFFDIFGTASVSYFAWPSSDSGDGGKLLAAYTAQFGNGFSGTISVEEPRRTGIVNGSAVASAWTLGQSVPNQYGNQNMPDIVGNLRVDQAWGSAQVMGVVHQVRAGYYGSSTGTTNLEGNGHPDDKYGWVIGAGVQLNADMISKGDKFQFQVSYTEGALKYLADTQFGGGYAMFSGTNVGFGWTTDGVFTGTTAATGSSIELTKGLAITGSYDHLWNQKWKTSVYGGLVDVKYGATANAAMCVANATFTITGTCNNDWSTYWVGTRTQFNINASTYMGVDVLYTKLNSASEGSTFNLLANTGSKPAGAYTIKDQDNLAVTFRVHRDFLP